MSKLKEALEESNKQAEDTAAGTAPSQEKTKEESAQEENLSEKQTQEVETSEIDYKAELEAERKRREKAEEKLVKLKKEKKEVSEDLDLESKLEELLNRKLSDIEMRTQQREYERAVSSLSESAEEAELINWHLENSIRLSGDPAEDVRRAKLLANEKRLLRENKELAESSKVRATVSKTPNISGQKTQAKKEPEYTSDEIRLLKRFKVI